MMTERSTKPLPSLADPAILLATWFGAGHMRKAPGTWGSAAALPFAWVIVWLGGWQTLLAAAVLLFPIGCWAAKRYMAAIGSHDPGAVVVDEVVGQWLVLLVAPLDPLSYLIGFALFRLFDITKPWPIRVADRSVGGGFGVMFDDVLAAVYAVILLAGFEYLRRGVL